MARQGAFYYPEILGPGVALFDFDNDGDLDVYLVQGASLGKPANCERPQALRVQVAASIATTSTCVPDGSRSLRFTDVTRESGIRATQYGLGVAAGDVDNDGWVDLLLTNFGANQLLRNNGDGTFADVTASSGLLDDARFAVSAAFVDYDRDGWLDLYVANNVNYTIANETQCPNPAGRRDYCPPQIYGGRPDQLYRNRGGGTFTDVTAKALVGGRFGPALGLSTADFNGDGWIDIFVANDGEDNLLWINQRDGTLRESALLAGVAVTGEGKAEASMGVDAGDFDNDGDEDLDHHRADRRGQQPVRERRHREVPRHERGIGSERDQPAVHRLGHRMVRLRQRRVARRVCGQRHDRGERRRTARSVSVRSAQGVVSQSRHRPVRGRVGEGWLGIQGVGVGPRRGVW